MFTTDKVTDELFGIDRLSDTTMSVGPGDHASGAVISQSADTTPGPFDTVNPLSPYLGGVRATAENGEKLQIREKLSRKNNKRKLIQWIRIWVILNDDQL